MFEIAFPFPFPNSPCSTDVLVLADFVDKGTGVEEIFLSAALNVELVEIISIFFCRLCRRFGGAELNAGDARLPLVG